MNLCKAPFTGMTIDPLGFIALCCNSVDRKNSFIKITEVDDLHEYFIGEQYEYWRELVLEEGFESIPSCRNCTMAVKNNASGEYLRFNNYKISTPLKINYLEVTNSNICNQNCSTCGSLYSTKWRKFEKDMPEWARHNVAATYLSDESINKIMKVLPNLQTLDLKGGEPFADKNNLKFLKELVVKNPECSVNITSNFEHIPDSWWETLSSLKNLKIGASIDGIGRKYDWIRSGDFENTLNNLQRFHSITGIKPSINVCVSVYNIFSLREISDFFDGYNVSMSNIVNTPKYLSPNIIKSDKLKKIVYEQFDGNIPSDLKNSMQYEELCDNQLIKKFKDYTNSMNKIRNSNIFDLEPNLVSIFD